MTSGQLNTAARGQSQIALIDQTDWRAEPSTATRQQAISALEGGDVLFFPGLAFEVSNDELRAFSPDIVGSSKNVGFDPSTGRVGGTTLDGNDFKAMREMLARYSRQTLAFIDSLVPGYRGRVAIGRTSFRPVEVAGRRTSWRKDDTRLHIDSFPSSPVSGSRILRVFTNVNPERRARTWRVGEEFEHVARRFAGALRTPLPGTARLLHWLRLTKAPRSAYDAMMLQLHDHMKADVQYQADCPQTKFDFPSGSTWVAFTDQVSHAAMAGQYQLEQTLLVPIDAMQEEWRSPLRVLERLKGRCLAPTSPPRSPQDRR
jgi:hypothetical protein